MVAPSLLPSRTEFSEAVAAYNRQRNETILVRQGDTLVVGDMSEPSPAIVKARFIEYGRDLTLVGSEKLFWPSQGRVGVRSRAGAIY